MKMCDLGFIYEKSDFLFNTENIQKCVFVIKGTDQKRKLTAILVNP